LLLHYLQARSYVHSMQKLLQNRLNRVHQLASQQPLNQRHPVLRRLVSGNHYESEMSLRLVRTLLRDTPASNQHQVLKLAFNLAEPGHNQFASMALLALTHQDPPVVVMALQILGKTQMRHLMDQVAPQLEHSHADVRTAAAAALARYGEPSLKLARDYLMSPRLEVVEAAIGAIAQVRTRRAADILYHYLQPQYAFFTQRLVGTDQRTANALVLQHPTLSRDYWQFVDCILSVLTYLEGEEALNPIRRSLQDADIRVRARALELLASLSHRRFIMSIFSLLEEAILKEAIFKDDILKDDILEDAKPLKAQATPLLG
jgi:HEAT repeat protein